MQVLDAEAILEKHDFDFYNSLQMECSEGFPSPRKRKAYWTEKVTQEFPVDATLLAHTKLDPFSFYAGLKAGDPKTRLMLRNFKTLKCSYDKLAGGVVAANEPQLKFLAECIQTFDPLPAHLLLAKCYFTLALAVKENLAQAKKYAAEVIQQLGLAVSEGYGRERYRVYCEYDKTLFIDKDDILKGLLQEKLITVKQLDKHRCMESTTLEDILPKEQMRTGCLVLH